METITSTLIVDFESLCCDVSLFYVQLLLNLSSRALRVSLWVRSVADLELSRPQSFPQLDRAALVAIVWLTAIGLRLLEILFVQKEMTRSSEKAIIECQECFPISFHNSPAPRSWLDGANWSARVFFYFPPLKEKHLLDLISYKAEECLKAMQTLRGYSERSRNQTAKEKKTQYFLL